LRSDLFLFRTHLCESRCTVFEDSFRWILFSSFWMTAMRFPPLAKSGLLRPWRVLLAATSVPVPIRRGCSLASKGRLHLVKPAFMFPGPVSRAFRFFGSPFWREAGPPSQLCQRTFSPSLIQLRSLWLGVTFFCNSFFSFFQRGELLRSLLTSPVRCVYVGAPGLNLFTVGGGSPW